MATKKVNDDTAISIKPLEIATSTFMLLGLTPLILNRMPEKARQELLMPKGRKTAADKASSLKHDPMAEFRASPTIIASDDAPTLIGVPASAIKKAIAAAALDIPGAKKSQIGRLTYVRGDVIPVYGVPQVMSAIVRSADINRTPDVRTRCVLPAWCAMVTIEHPAELISTASLANLLAAAGRFIGVGDWRSERGAGNYGSFTLADPSDAAVKTLMKIGTRKTQTEAMAAPEAHNAETRELLGWFGNELKARGLKLAA